MSWPEVPRETQGMPRGSQKAEQGVALVLAVVVLLVLSVLIAGLSSEVFMDLGISKNLKLQTDAFNWAESCIEATEEMIAYAIDSRGDDAGASYNATIQSANYTIRNPGSTLFLDNGTVEFLLNSKLLANCTVRYLGQQMTEGGSIVIAAGYEGVGKGAGSGGGVSILYTLESEGGSRVENARQKVSEVYRYTGR